MKKYMNEWEKVFQLHRSFLISFGFRMTGSLSEAEDLIQDIFIKCINIDPAKIQNHKSWLTKICSNKGIDHLKQAYKRRETYPGTWLPDAVPDNYQMWTSHAHDDSPDKKLILSESLTTSFLLLVEKLSPEERVIYLLSEIFEYSFKEISSFLKKSEDACKKTAQRARASVASGQSRFDRNSVNARASIARFFELAKTGDKEALVEMLADTSEFWSDGGGKVPALATILDSKNAIADFFVKTGSSPVFTSKEYKFEVHEVNNRPGLVISKHLPNNTWAFETIISYEFVSNQIARIYAQRNPDKFRALILSA